MALYPYQERVKSLIQSGQSVILQAPTGAGKTRAALAPFIEQFFVSPANVFPRKCIYSVPMQVLANQFVSEYKGLAETYQRMYRGELTASIQTGDRPEDPKFEGNLVFATIDQTLSSFLNIPYGLGSGSANLNAGAVVSSYLVFDELHLFDPDTSLPTTLEMLRSLRGTVPFIVMTATFSGQMLHSLGNLLDAVVIPEDDEMRQEMEGIGSQKGKDRRFYVEDHPLTAKAVLDPGKRGLRTICICNTVQSAKKLYQEIETALNATGDKETMLCLLHSQFLKTDRDAKEAWIKAEFGKSQAEYQGPPLILVATQVIEVGVDATCDVMHTELSPASSILQRAGRCARRENERGGVYVYLPRDEEGRPNYAPYFIPRKAHKTRRGLQLCEATWETLNQAQFQDRPMSFRLEQALIDAVHTPIDQEILSGLIETRSLHRQEMLSTMVRLDRGKARDLIRDVDNVFLLLHPEPEKDEHLQHNPWYYDGFSLSHGSLHHFYKEIEALADPEETPWIMKTAKRIDHDNHSEREEGPTRQPPEFAWASLNSADDIFGCPVLAVHPSVARYDPKLGLVFELSNTSAPLYRRPKDRSNQEYSYHLESYAEHVAGLLNAYLHTIYERKTNLSRLPLREEVAYALTRMEKDLQIPPGTLDQMLRALFATHDLGKLNRDWQDWVHKWQSEAGQFYGGKDLSVPEDYMIAHTDYEPGQEQKALQKKMGHRPPHAAESAVAAEQILDDLCGANEFVWQAAMTALARHHYAATDSYRQFRCHRAAKKAVREALQIVGLPVDLANGVKWQDDGTKLFSQALVDFQEMSSLRLYFLFSRVLRLADQRSQANRS